MSKPRKGLQPVRRCLLGRWYVTPAESPRAVGCYVGSTPRLLGPHPLQFLALAHVLDARAAGFDWSYCARQKSVFEHRGFLLHVEI